MAGARQGDDHQLKSIGIEKGKPFSPDQRTRDVLTDAAGEAHAWLVARYEASFSSPFYDGGQWALPGSRELLEGQATFFAKPDVYPVDVRGVTFSYAYFTPKHLGTGSSYLLAIADKDGRLLDGGMAYRLTVPSDVPVRQYWSATVYDRATHAPIRSARWPSRSSLTLGLQENAARHHEGARCQERTGRRDPVLRGQARHPDRQRHYAVLPRIRRSLLRAVGAGDAGARRARRDKDAWQVAILETEAPGKYLVLAPGQEVPDDVAGYQVRHSPTFNIFLGVRLTDPDPQGAKEALAQLRMYPYAQRDNQPKTEIFDAGTKAWSGLPPRGIEYWERLDDVIQREPIEPRDIFFHAMLRPLGLEKGNPFEPDARQTKILTDAALVGEAMAKANSADRRFAGVKYRSDAHWDVALQLDADDPAAFWNLLDERASWFYEAVGAGAAMAPMRPGPSSAYLSAYKDKAGKWLDGGTSYRLRVPPNPPIRLFWSVTVYDADTRALILNEQKVADRSSRMDLQKNEDGSVDIYCGPQAPAGFEKNWIPTVPGKNWLAYFRFYQPTEAYFDRSWPLPDFEQV